MEVEPRAALLRSIWERVDPRLRPALERDFHQPRPALELGTKRVVLVGQRAAGKSWLCELIGRWVALPAFDLDREIEARSGRRIAEWLRQDPTGFRTAEREHFATLERPAVVAAGGGFLSLHGDLLRDEVAVLVPVTFETYHQRLRADGSRPRLRPELSLEDELATVYQERERQHAAVTTLGLAQFLRATVGA